MKIGPRKLHTVYYVYGTQEQEEIIYLLGI